MYVFCVQYIILQNAQYIVLYVLHCIALHCIALHCIALYCNVDMGCFGRTILLYFLFAPADKCPDVNISFGSFEGEFIPGKNLNFTCNPGYTLVGMEVLKCNQNSTWDGDFPKCLSEWQSVWCPMRTKCMHVCYSCFTVSSPVSPLPTAITLVSKVLESQISHEFQWQLARETLQFQCYTHVGDCSVQWANRTRNRETTVAEVNNVQLLLPCFVT